ncbi:MAG: SDR family oxidoreductase [Anaerolineae bacterium]
MDLTEITLTYNLAGHTVAITGGAGILGGEMAYALVGCGANVAILDRDPALADRLIKRIQMIDKPGIGKVIVVYADVLKRDTLVKAEEAIRNEFGAVDILINAAGGNKPAATTGADLSFFDVPEDALRFVFDLNLLGTVIPCQVFGRGMAERGEGVILNISSMAAFRPLTRVVAYSAAKAGVSNFTQWLAVYMAQEYSPRIRVNALAPGFFLTEQNRYLLTDKETGELTPRGKAIIAHTPMGRFGAPEDLIGAVLWLVSPASSFVTGAVIPIDGGFSAFSGV